MKSALLCWSWCRIQRCRLFDHESDSRGVKSMPLSANLCWISSFNCCWSSSSLSSALDCLVLILWLGLNTSCVVWTKSSLKPCNCSPLRPWIIVRCTPHSSSKISLFIIWQLGHDPPLLVKSSSEIPDGSIRCSGTHRRTRRHVWTLRRMPRHLKYLPIICRSTWNSLHEGPCVAWCDHIERWALLCQYWNGNTITHVLNEGDWCHIEVMSFLVYGYLKKYLPTWRSIRSLVSEHPLPRLNIWRTYLISSWTSQTVNNDTFCLVSVWQQLEGPAAKSMPWNWSAIRSYSTWVACPFECKKFCSKPPWTYMDGNSCVKK